MALLNAASPATTGKALRTLTIGALAAIGRMPDARTVASRATGRTRTPDLHRDRFQRDAGLERGSPGGCVAGVSCRLRGTRQARAHAAALAVDVRGRRDRRRGKPAGNSRSSSRRNLTPYRVTATDGADAGLVTGYYEPLLRGSRYPGPAFPSPLYAPPDDLARRRIGGPLSGTQGEAGPRTTRRAPRRSVLATRRHRRRQGERRGQGARVRRPIPSTRSSSQIQGSGRVALAEGGVMRVGYADQNGQPFRSVGSRADRPRRIDDGRSVDAGHSRVGP